MHSKQQMRRLCCLLFVCFSTMSGCVAERPLPPNDPLMGLVRQVEPPRMDEPPAPKLALAPEPRVISEISEDAFWDLTLSQAIEIALENSRVLRDVGGRLLDAPATATTVDDIAIAITDPRAGEVAALAAFDAQLGAGIFTGRDERTLNNILLGGGTRSLTRDYAGFQYGITKKAVTGTELTAKHTVNYDQNNAPFNRFPSYFDTVFQGEVTHPLLQGGGVEFNRIAGPLAQPGIYNGVLIARTNADVAIADLQNAVETLVFDVENAYWDLYLAYHDLDAKNSGWETSLRTWQRIARRQAAGDVDREQEMRAREQLLMFEIQRYTAANGSSVASPIVANTGVLTAERRLRRLMGLPPTDHNVLRPADQPIDSPIVFDWSDSIANGLARRAELRRQRWIIKRRELELKAARNYLLPKLDFVGQYALRGFGDNLFGDNSSYGDLFSGDLTEYRVGLQLSHSLGSRLANAQVRNALFKLRREQAILDEQQLIVAHEVSEAHAGVERGFRVLELSAARLAAAREQEREAEIKAESGLVPLDYLLDSQRRSVEAKVGLHRARVDYTKAIAKVYESRGDLLPHHGVRLHESPATQAEVLSARRESRKLRDFIHPASIDRPDILSTGPADPGVRLEVPSTHGPTPDATIENIESLPAPEEKPERLEPASIEFSPANQLRSMTSPWQQDSHQRGSEQGDSSQDGATSSAQTQSLRPVPAPERLAFKSPAPESEPPAAPLTETVEPTSRLRPPQNGILLASWNPPAPKVAPVSTLQESPDSDTEPLEEREPESEQAATDSETIGRAPPTQNTQNLAIRRSSAILNPGQIEIDYGFSYVWRGDQLLRRTADTLTVDRKVRTRQLINPVQIRYGWSNNIQLFASLPHGMAIGEVADDQGRHSPVRVGFGDIGIGATALLWEGERHQPSVYGSIFGTGPAGPDFLDAEDNTASLTAGYWQFGTSLNFVQRIDPVAIFGSVNYIHPFSRNTFGLDNNPGEIFGYSFGTAFSVNDRVSLSGIFIGSYQGTTRFDGVEIPQSSLESMGLRLATTLVPNECHVIEPFTQFGLNEDTSQTSVGAVLTRRY